MEYVFSILMFCMAGGILLYAGLIALTGDPKLIVRHWAARMPDPKRYARDFALVLVITAGAFLLAGLVGLSKIVWLGLIVLAAAFVGAMIAASGIMKKHGE